VTLGLVILMCSMADGQFAAFEIGTLSTGGKWARPAAFKQLRLVRLRLSAGFGVSAECFPTPTTRKAGGLNHKIKTRS
jgi:hypothetical protein